MPLLVRLTTTTCLPATMQVTRAGCGPPHAPARRPRDKKGTLEITLGIPRLKTGRTSGRGLQLRHQGQHEGAPPRHTNRPDRLAGSQGGSGTTSTRLGGVSAPALASPEGAPPAGLPALDRAPPPPPVLSALDRAPPPELPGPEHPCRHPLVLASEVTRAKRAFKAAQATVLRREARRQRHEKDIESAKDAAREESLVVERTRRALALSATSTAEGAATALAPPARPLDVTSQESRPGDDAFKKNSVARMASTPRVEFSAELANVVVEMAPALLQSERKVLLHPEKLSVGEAWPVGKMAPFLDRCRALRPLPW